MAEKKSRTVAHTVVEEEFWPALTICKLNFQKSLHNGILQKMVILNPLIFRPAVIKWSGGSVSVAMNGKLLQIKDVTAGANVKSVTEITTNLAGDNQH